MKKLISQSLLVIFAVSSMMACKKNSNDNGSVSGGRDVRVASGPSGIPTNQGNSTGVGGYYITGTNQAQFDEAIRVLVAPTVTPTSVGSTSLQNGVELRGSVVVNPSTGAVLNTSLIQITITDSNVGQVVNGQQVPPIAIKLAGASGSATNYNANLTFSDNVGTITITGTYDTSNFRGRVTFVNKTTPYNGKTSGELGSFVIPTCAFFVCQ
jgi:hypothetical protein